jgi:hypothetical protein
VESGTTLRVGRAMDGRTLRGGRAAATEAWIAGADVRWGRAADTRWERRRGRTWRTVLRSSIDIYVYICIYI